MRDTRKISVLLPKGRSWQDVTGVSCCNLGHIVLINIDNFTLKRKPGELKNHD
jgi:hypothetical protein